MIWLVRLPAQLSCAVAPRSANVPWHSTTSGFAPNNVSTGATVSTTVTVWLHAAELLHASVADQLRVTARFPPTKLVAVPVTRMVTGAPPQESIAVGLSKLPAEPHSTLLFH